MEMKAFTSFTTTKNLLIAACLIVILFLGNYLRSYSYDTVPHPGETADEYAFAWAGLSMIQDGFSTSWSYVDEGYPEVWDEKINVDAIYDKDPVRPAFRMVKPWFDKPPLFSLLIGGFSYLKGVREPIAAGTAIIRRPMLRVAVLTTLLLFWLAYRLYDKKVALISTLLYSIIPTFVISSRLALSENAIIPVFLLALILMDYYLKSRKIKYVYFASVLAAIALLMKMSGVVVLVSILTILFLNSDKKVKIKNLITSFLIGISGLVVFAIYGWIVDWQTFKQVFLTQSNLFYGASSEVFFSAVVHSKITANKFFTDGWVTLSWISAFMIGFSEWKKNKGTTLIITALFSYFVIFLFFGSESYGWYRFPFFPFLAILLAKLMVKLYDQQNYFVALALFLLPFGTIVHKLIGVFGFQNYVGVFRFFIFSYFGLFFVSNYFDKRAVFVRKAMLIAMFVFLLVLSVKMIIFYNYDNWFFVT